MSEGPYESQHAPWDGGRVYPDDWDISDREATNTYEALLTEVGTARKALGAAPEVVVVGVPEYKALWVYVERVETEPRNPEALVPQTMVVVSGSVLQAQRRNLDVLFDADRS